MCFSVSECIVVFDNIHLMFHIYCYLIHSRSLCHLILPFFSSADWCVVDLKVRINPLVSRSTNAREKIIN